LDRTIWVGVVTLTCPPDLPDSPLFDELHWHPWIDALFIWAPMQSDRAREATGILDNLRRIVRALRESSRSAERAFGVSGAQLFALRVLAQSPSLSLNELAARTHTHQSTVSVVVKRLVAAKLVSRAVSAEDARRVELAVTLKGRALLRKAPLAAQEHLVEGIAQLTRRDSQQLSVSLQRLVEAMQLTAEPALMFFEEDEAAPRTREKSKHA
jgi:DNA-binding MarR family transcriptional regulator